MKKEKENNEELPVSGIKSNKIEFSIERGFLVKVIILILVLCFILGCELNKNNLKLVSCRNTFQATSGWVSGESDINYWIVNDEGKTVKFNKANCSIKG